MTSYTDYNNHIIYNPEGKIKQIEYVKNTVGLGNTVVALKNNNAGVIVTYNIKRSIFAEYQKKIFKINDYSLFSFSGITNDGNKIVKYLKYKYVNEHVIKERKIHPIHVFDDLCYDASFRTLVNGSRMYGVEGFLLTDYDGICLTNFSPMGVAKEVKGLSIGNRSQSCRTILEDECHEFDNFNVEQLIFTGLKSLKNAYPEEGLLSNENVEIWILKKNGIAMQVDSKEYLN